MTTLKMKPLRPVATKSQERLLTVGPLVLDAAFQPIVEATTGVVFGYESLMRGQERIGYETPLQMLDHAHQQGCLFALETMLTGKAVTKLLAMPDYRNRTLFLNLDARLIPIGDQIIENLLHRLDAVDLPPSSICFELSERFDNTSYSEFPHLAQTLRRSGFKIAIDDFGVGHGEMKLLCDFPIDYVKIDRFLVDKIDANPRKRHLFRNIVSICHQLGIRVIAEGIETEAEFLLCRELGADMVQGWYVQKPNVNVEQLLTHFPRFQDVARDQPQSRTIDETLIRQNMEPLTCVDENDDIEQAFELFRQNPQQHYFPVLNASGEPRGIISEYQIKDLIYQPFARDLLKNREYKRKISHFVQAAPIVSLNHEAEKMLDTFTTMRGNECVLVTENMRYVGTMSAASLLRVVNEKQLKIAQDQNPLTHLPGNRLIGDHISRLAAEVGETRFFCYCDFDNFKPFNDCYGFHLGDHAIMLFAAMLRRYFLSKADFLGHVGGDDFFIGANGWEASELSEILDRLLSDFNEEVANLYSPEDRANQSMKGLDRYGQLRAFPLIRCSIGVLQMNVGVSEPDQARLGHAIAHIKSMAKASDSGLAFMDYAIGADVPFENSH
jgi:diguanylate cyclase (GGDEF)-like protein